VWTWIEQIRELFAGLHAGIYPDFGTWTYILLGVLVATEGPLSTLLGASASAAGLLDWRWVLTATVIGNVAGDCIWYFAGYLGKMSWLYEHGRWFGMRPHHVARLEREMRAHATKLIIFAKIAYGLIVPTLVAAGLARVPWRKWFPVVFVVETLWSILLVWVGYHTTAFIADFEQTIQAVGIAILVAVVIFIVMRFLRKRIDEQELALDPLHHSSETSPMNSVTHKGATAADEAAPAELTIVEPRATGESKADSAAKNLAVGRSNVQQFKMRESERIR
jgi:membrane protein DedA with SNARE-associated domain